MTVGLLNGSNIFGERKNRQFIDFLFAAMSLRLSGLMMEKVDIYFNVGLKIKRK